MAGLRLSSDSYSSPLQGVRVARRSCDALVSKEGLHFEMLPDMDSKVVTSNVFCRFMSDLLCRRLVKFAFFLRAMAHWAHSRASKMASLYKTAFIPMSWDAVTHNKQTWGYPLALECVSLIYNKKLVTGKPPAQLSEYPAFAKELKAKDPKLIAIMWDYKTP